MTLVFMRPALALKYIDAFEYLSAATALFDGRGLLALSGQAQTIFPPGYPLAIVASMLVVRDPVKAAVFVSLLSSSLSLALTFSLLRRWQGALIASIATALFALMPLRVWMAQSALSESLTLASLLLAVWAYTRQQWSPGIRGIVVGLALGWAYLTRPEALLIAAGMLVLATIQARRGKQAWTFIIVTAAVLCCIVMPYVVWLHAQTGAWTLSGKTGNFAIAAVRAHASQDVEWRRLNGDRSAIVAAAPMLTLRDMAAHYLSNLRIERDRILANIGVEPFAGMLLVWGLLGVLRRAAQRRDGEQVALLLILLAPLAVFPLLWIEDRFLIQAAPILTLGVATGVAECVAWLQHAWKDTWRRAHFWSAFIGVACITAIGSSYILRSYTTTFSEDATRASREIAALISAQAPGRSSEAVIGEYPGVAYFAGLRQEWLPSDDLSAVRQYATQKHVRFLVCSPQDVQTPATARLLAGDFSTKEARLIGSVRAGEIELLVYQLVPWAE
ncbi:MAG: glycosyltransferase family 39 protein [Kouleothrix sp.]|nr:glycosyltransferase family 39 protein [Kouleothrix sp.]